MTQCLVVQAVCYDAGEWVTYRSVFDLRPNMPRFWFAQSVAAIQWGLQVHYTVMNMTVIDSQQLLICTHRCCSPPSTIVLLDGPSCFCMT